MGRKNVQTPPGKRFQREGRPSLPQTPSFLLNLPPGCGPINPDNKKTRGQESIWRPFRRILRVCCLNKRGDVRSVGSANIPPFKIAP
jgi:hypothetical protein